MISFVRKNPIFLISKNLSNRNVEVCRSIVSLHFFSTSSQPSMDPAVFDILVHKYDFPSGFASRVASELTGAKNPETADSTLSFLKSRGFSNAQLQKILIYKPRFLCCSLENNIKPKIKIFEDEGFSSADISKIISSNATILEISVKKNIIPSLSLLKGLLGSKTDVIKIIKLCPRLLTANLEKNVVPNFDFLMSCGVGLDRVRIILKGFPSAFCGKPEVIRAAAEKAKAMGINAASKAFVYAIPPIASMSNEAWEAKLQGFRDMGFSDSDISTMFRKAPLVFSASMAKIKKITDALLATGKFHLASIVNYPISLSYSFEKRYEPRLRVLTLLETRKLIKGWPSLRMICQTSDDDFIEGFIRPYSNQVSDDLFLERFASALKH